MLQQPLPEENETGIDSVIPAPDSVSFTTLLKAYCAPPNARTTPQALEKAETLLGQMYDLYHHGGMMAAKPNVISFTTVMNGYRHLQQPEKAQQVLHRLEDLYRQSEDEDDWKPDVAAYNSVLLAWARSGNLSATHEFLQYMYEEGLARPNEVSFNTVLTCLLYTSPSPRD